MNIFSCVNLALVGNMKFYICQNTVNNDNNDGYILFYSRPKSLITQLSQ